MYDAVPRLPPRFIGALVLACRLEGMTATPPSVCFIGSLCLWVKSVGEVLGVGRWAQGFSLVPVAAQLCTPPLLRQAVSVVCFTVVGSLLLVGAPKVQPGDLCLREFQLYCQYTVCIARPEEVRTRCVEWHIVTGSACVFDALYPCGMPSAL